MWYALLVHGVFCRPGRNVHPLMRAAFWLCPPEFRRRFADQIGLDEQHKRGLALVAACWNIAITGVALRTEDVARDLSFAMRMLRKAPAYTLVTILTFALSIGANVAVASAINAVLLRPLPFPDADRLLLISQGAELQTRISNRNARDLASESTTLSGVGLVRETSATTNIGDRVQLLRGWVVDASYFDVVGVQPERGRLLDAGDLGTSNIVISDEAWRHWFGSSPKILGTVVRLDDRAATIVGVLPAEFRDPVPGSLALRDYWSMIDPHSILAESRDWTGFHGVARMLPGVSVDAARADILRVLRTDEKRYPKSFVGVEGVTVLPVLAAIVGSTQQMLWLLYAAVGMVLLIACVNIANLALARTASRERELAVRAALGASRKRIIVQLFTELSLLTTAGGMLGVVLALAGIRVVSMQFSNLLPRWESVALDPAVLLYALLLVVLTTFLTGILPIFAQRRDLTRSLNAAGRAGSATIGRALRTALVVTEVTLAVAVIISAGLVIRSFLALTHVDVGFDPEHLSVISITLPTARYNTPEKAIAFERKSLPILRAAPGIESAAMALIVPFSTNTYPRAFTIPGKPDPHAAVPTDAITGGYFSAMRIPLLRGRDFNANDTARAAPVAIVTATFARRYFGSTDVIGKQLGLIPFTLTAAVPMTIVAVAGDTRASLAATPDAQIYVPFEQLPSVLFFVVRSSLPSATLLAQIDASFRDVDSNIAPPSVQSYGELLHRDAIRARAAMLLFGTLALLSLLLALAGVYAVTAYGVVQRTREFGIRQALGARAQDLLVSVVGDAMVQASLGIASGLVVAAIFGRLLQGLLFQTSPLDPLTLVGSVGLILAAITCAALLPAHRASRVDPAVTIRYE
jgi:putative ABC transport system permease protein